MFYTSKLLITILLLVVMVQLSATTPTGVQKEKFVYFLFQGNSSMKGRSPMGDTLEHSRCWYLNANQDITSFNWVKATDVTIPTNFESDPVYHFIKRMAARYPEYHFGAIKTFQEGAGLDNVRGTQYTTAKKMIDAAKSDGIFGGVIVMAWDDGDAGLASTYKTRALDYMQKIRADYSIPNLPFAWGDAVLNAHSSRRGPYVQEIHNQIVSLCSSDPQNRSLYTPPTAFPFTRYYYVDSHHYTYQGNKIFSDYIVDQFTSRGWNYWATSSPTADTQKPSKPENLRLSTTESTATSATVDWNKSTDNCIVDGYRISVNGTVTDTVPRYICKHTVKGLTPGQNSTIKVEALDAAGNMSESATLVYTPPSLTEKTAPTSPANFRLVSMNSQGATFTWDKASDPSGIAGYKFGILFDLILWNDVWYDFMSVDSSTNQLTMNITYMKMFHGYKTRVHLIAIDRAGNESGHQWIDITFNAVADTSPPLTMLYPLGGESFTIGKTEVIRWKANLQNVSSINIEFSADSGDAYFQINASGSIPASAGQFSWTVPSLVNGISLANKDILVKITDYDKKYSVETENFIHINTPSSIRNIGYTPGFKNTDLNAISTYNLQGRKFILPVLKTKGSTGIYFKRDDSKASKNKIERILLTR